MTHRATNTQGFCGAIRAAYERLYRAFMAQSLSSRVITVMLAIMIVGGAVVRVQGLAWPHWFTFDEEPFVTNAQHYAVNTIDNNDHPPFGKLLIGWGITLFGYNSLGWRFVPLVFGLQFIVLAYFFARILFDDRRAGYMAAAFVAADGFYISYSRSGLLDGTMICLMLWGLVAAVSARSWVGVLTAGIFFGLSATVKWSGAMAAIPAAVIILLQRRVSIFSVLWLGVIPVVHTLVWMGALQMTGQPHGVDDTWKVIIGLYKHHLTLGKYKNELSSAWWGWPILWHPIVIKLSTSGLKSRYSSSVGNLLFWATTTLSVVAFPIITIVVLAKTKLTRYWLSVLDTRVTKGILVMLLGWVAFMAPWILARNTRGNYTFSHYYLPCYAFMLVALAGACSHLERKHAKAIAIYLGIAFAIALFYVPVWGEFALTVRQANLRLIFHNWRP
jgi:dolichyl-phosphate-mannose--protein O-mannosyl transferase